MIVSFFSAAGCTNWDSLGVAPTTDPVGRAQPAGISGMASPFLQDSISGFIAFSADPRRQAEQQKVDILVLTQTESAL
jgi:hypothetical protein